MRETEQNSCQDKAAYSTAEAAKAAAIQADFQYKRERKLVPYRCQECGLYHLKTDYDDV